MDPEPVLSRNPVEHACTRRTADDLSLVFPSAAVRCAARMGGRPMVAVLGELE